jgi:hypothetical protein
MYFLCKVFVTVQCGGVSNLSEGRMATLTIHWQSGLQAHEICELYDKLIHKFLEMWLT